MTTENQPESEVIDLNEKGRQPDGTVISSDRRLFVQLYAFTGCPDLDEVVAACANTKINGVIYADLNDPQGFALVTFSENPDYFIDTIRPLLNLAPFTSLTAKPEFTMLGRRRDNLSK